MIFLQKEGILILFSKKYFCYIYNNYFYLCYIFILIT